MSEGNSILHMTEHGAYVWPSYAVVALVMVALVIVSLRTLRRTEKDLKQAESDAGTTRNEA